MTKHRAVGIVVLVALASTFGATASHAQKEILAGGYFTAGFPMGDWGEIAGFGLGVDHTDVIFPKPTGPLAFRSSLGLHYNFSRTVGVPSSNLPPNSLLELETKNWSVFFGVGPEFGARTGNVRPFVYGAVGFDTYWTKSELAGTAGGSPYSANHGDSRIVFAWSAGVGARRVLSDGLMGEVSVEYRSGSGHKFLLPDEITGSGTTVNASRDSRTTDQILVRLGTLFNL